MGLGEERNGAAGKAETTQAGHAALWLAPHAPPIAGSLAPHQSFCCIAGALSLLQHRTPRCPPRRTLWERDLIEEELQHLMHEFDGMANASYRRGMSIISLICNVQRTSLILERVGLGLGRRVRGGSGQAGRGARKAPRQGA